MSETEEFFIIGVNNSGECVDGVLDNDSDLGKALIENNETSIEKISQERKNVIFEKAKDYLGTNIELVNPRAKIAFEGIVQEEKIEFKK